jgi:hypothetical protein
LRVDRARAEEAISLPFRTFIKSVNGEDDRHPAGKAGQSPNQQIVSLVNHVQALKAAKREAMQEA